MKKLQLMLLIAALSTSMTAGADTIKYTGVLYASSYKSMMPLANGDAVVLVEADGIASLSETPPAILDVKCAGMAIVDEEDNATTSFYCSFLESIENGFDVKGTLDGKLGNFKVIGGVGKWANAKGQGKFTQVIQTPEGSKNIFELKITTP